MLTGFFVPSVWIQAATKNDLNFSESSKKYKPELAKAALELSGVSYDTKALDAAFSDFGFLKTGTKYYNYEETDRTSGVAFALSKQKITVEKEPYTVIAVVIRGTNGKEWYGNFNLTDVDLEKENAAELLKEVTVHEDFENTMQEVLTKLNAYAKKIKGPKKLLITGHSRGAAVANLLASKLTEEEKMAKQEDIYAYTFATPNVTNTPLDQENIFNFVNAEDFVTYVPLPQWGFSKHGITICFQEQLGDLSKKPALLKKMKKTFLELTGKEFKEFPNGSKDTKDFVKQTGKLTGSLEDYYFKKYQVGEGELTLYEYFNLAADLLAGSKEEKEAATQVFTKTFIGPFSSLTSYWMNMELIGMAHYPDTYMSWLLLLEAYESK